MNKTPQTLKGFRDFTPAEARKRDWLKKILVNTFESWGFEPLETPTLEPLEIFEGQIGEDEKLFFRFQDLGGRDVALRYDQTIPTCRFVGQNYQNLPKPFKRYQMQPVFRAEKPQKGRYREFLQCDADIFGSNSPVADAEVIALSLEQYRQIGFKNVRVLINDRSLFKDMPYEAIVAIDKLKKIGKSGVIEEMITKGIGKDQAQKYLTYIENAEPNETIKVILQYLEAAGFPKDWYTFDPTIARSFSYSSGPIWEVEIPEYTTGSVLGGERFDGLTEQITGVSVPATGFGLGFDRTLEAAEALGLIPEFESSSQALVTLFDQSTLPASLETAQKLRAAGIKTEVYPAFDKLGKQFKLANQKNIPYVVIIGNDELKQNKITLKNMESGDQSLVSVEEAIQDIK